MQEQLQLFELDKFFIYCVNKMMINSTPMTVSELTGRIKRLLEEKFGAISLQGEISNFKRHTSGHLYFTLKDEHSQISAVMWRGRAQTLYFTPQDGMRVLVRGSISVYEVRGVYQVDVIQMEPLGEGELQLAFERLKRKLAAEGLFDAAKKKPLPQYPRQIGLITSPTGAALQDMLNIFRRRCPSVELILLPVRVQGAEAAGEIAQAIADMNAYGKVDLIIVGRGGGSLEDLWAFNEEIVARAIAASRIPIISAVGHEIDFTIADFAADYRAPTPSAAAEIATRTTTEMVEILRNFWYTTGEFISDSLQSKRQRIISFVQSYSFNRPIDLLRQYSQHLDETRRSLILGAGHAFALQMERHRSLAKRIASVDPNATLERGFAIIYQDGSTVARKAAVERDQDVTIRFYDGRLSATIQPGEE